MTNEEAKIRIGEFACYARTKGWDDEYTEAVNMAINALEQEPCEDCIRRSDMLDAVGHGTTYTSEEVQDIIDGMPSVTPQPCEDCVSRQMALEAFGLSEKSRKYDGDHSGYDTLMKYEIQDILEDLPSVTPQPKPNIKALGEDIRICQKSITDKKVLIGFNMAVALCNKHLAESEVAG